MIVRHTVFICDVCDMRAQDVGYDQPDGWTQITVQTNKIAESAETTVNVCTSRKCLRRALIKLANEVPHE